ncbi:TIGR03750 family conjugal transfer protein [Xylophilus sp. ASV27]|uniref:TIGR03750 family conjugal transfer protein n=1 Tax=Xylophilus sp. ASV27 TaxID=2795129 RepID=UPI001E391563|nr:TIGR03750 family conjugal transfer protein [Xylophilus sp. ASV27]
MAQEHSDPGFGAMRAPLTDRVNSEPPIINGMSATEAGYLGLASLTVSAAAGGLLYALTGYWHFIFAVCVVGPMLTLWYGSLYLQQVKRGKPEGWYVQVVRIWCGDVGLARKHFLQHDGYYEIGRRLGFTVTGGGAQATGRITPSSARP